MGTNYYVLEENKDYNEDDISALIEPKYKMRHIGKSSAGWCFSLHVYPEDNINSWAQWKKILKSKENLILINEYYDTIDLDYLKEVVEFRSSQKNWKDFDNFIQDHGSILYENIDDLNHFLEKNNALKGPNNLLRHKISNHCIGHGDGPWDYIVGHFS